MKQQVGVLHPDALLPFSAVLAYAKLARIVLMEDESPKKEMDRGGVFRPAIQALQS